MIDLADSSFLRSAFASKAVMSRELYTRLRDELRQKEFSEGQMDLRRRKEQERAEDAEEKRFEAAVLATIDEIESFGHRIDVYDTATVEALMQNEVEFRAVRERIDQKLAQATALPDGRRVFKTEDGSKVFDEFGKEVSSDELTPDRIADKNPRFEGYWRDVEVAGALTEERAQIHEFQNHLDDVREKAGRKGITAEELDDLEKDIDAAMPDRVRKLAADKLGLPEPVAKADPANDDLSLDERDIPAVPTRGGITPGGP